MRPTREIVLIVFAATVGAVLIVSTGGLLTIEIVHPHADTTAGLSAVWDVTALLLGAIAGYLFAVRRKNGNGH